jgi:glycosyltransferase involved in cell wall biosynthesis
VKSDLVVFLDADDELHPTYLERCVAAWEEAGERTFVYTQWQETGTGDAVSAWPAFDVDRLLEWNYVHASALIPRAAVLENPYRHLRVGWEDWDFYLGLVQRGYSGVLVDEPLLLYRQHGASMIDRLYASDVKRRYALAVLAVRHLPLYGPRLAWRRVWAVGTGVVAAVGRRLRRRS